MGANSVTSHFGCARRPLGCRVSYRSCLFSSFTPRLVNPLLDATTKAWLVGAVALALSTDVPKAQFLPERGSAWAAPFTVADALPDESPPVWQDPENLQQATDTLDIILERIRALEAAEDSAQVVIADLERVVAGAVAEIARERGARTDAIDELLRSLLLLVDSASISVANDARTRIEEGLRSVRADAERGQATVRVQAESIARDLGNLRIRMDEQEATFHDSLATSVGLIEEERERRQSGDRRTRLLLGLASGLLLVTVGGVWWHGVRRVDAVRGKSFADGERAQHQLVRDHLRPLEELSSMLGTIRAAIEDADEQGGSEPSHDLPLKICNEMSRIDKNLRAMDSSIRGHKKLVGCVRRVKNNLRAHDYEVVELVGKPYDSGMLLEADFVEDDELAPGEEVITQINRPEVRYRGETIQIASVRVSIGL